MTHGAGGAEGAAGSRFETHSEADLTPDLCKACFALPTWCPAVETGGKTYIDGVYWKDANLSEAVARGADEIWVIWTVSETPVYRPGLYGVALGQLRVAGAVQPWQQRRRRRWRGERLRALTGLGKRYHRPAASLGRWMS